jgi:hypothetical protein
MCAEASAVLRAVAADFFFNCGHSHSHTRNCLDSNKNLVLGPGRGLTPRLTGRLTVGRNITATEFRMSPFRVAVV